MAALDRSALLTWIRGHADHPRPIVHAVLTGLADRIERGDFDQKKTAPESVSALSRGLTQHLERGGAMPMIMLQGTDNESGKDA